MNRLEEAVSAWPVNGLPATLADRTRRVYDRLAAVYPVSTMFFHSRAHRCALGASGLRDGMKVLEVATGSGEMFRRLIRANGQRHHGWGGSFAEHGGAHAAHGAPQISGVRGRTARRWMRATCRSATRAFDAVFCCYLLELLSAEDIVSTLGEFRRVLRDRGQSDAGADRAEHGVVQRDLQSAGQGGAGILGPAGGAARSAIDRVGPIRDPEGPDGAADLLSVADSGGEEVGTQMRSHGTGPGGRCVLADGAGQLAGIRQRAADADRRAVARRVLLTHSSGLR